MNKGAVVVAGLRGVIDFRFGAVEEVSPRQRHKGFEYLIINLILELQNNNQQIKCYPSFTNLSTY